MGKKIFNVLILLVVVIIINIHNYLAHSIENFDLKNNRTNRSKSRTLDDESKLNNIKK
jgi:hypothetical protein